MVVPNMPLVNDINWYMVKKSKEFILLLILWYLLTWT